MKLNYGNQGKIVQKNQCVCLFFSSELQLVFHGQTHLPTVNMVKRNSQNNRLFWQRHLFRHLRVKKRFPLKILRRRYALAIVNGGSLGPLKAPRNQWFWDALRFIFNLSESQFCPMTWMEWRLIQHICLSLWHKYSQFQRPPLPMNYKLLYPGPEYSLVLLAKHIVVLIFVKVVI